MAWLGPDSSNDVAREAPTRRAARRLGLLAALVLCVFVFQQVRHARALGTPTLTTLAYTGSLLTFGQPDNSMHTMVLALFVAGSNDGGLGSAACTTTAEVTPVNGQFTIPLSSSCATVVQTYPNIQSEVTVDSTAMGLINVSAVPYALEAGAAATVAAADVTGVLPLANGGTGSSIQNFVDLSSTQTIGGAKTFTSLVTVPCIPGFAAVNNGKLCVDTTLEAAANFYAAQPNCETKGKSYGIVSHVCHYTEAQDACQAYANGTLNFDFYAGAGGNEGWYSDETADDVFEIWNEVSCAAAGANNNGPPQASSLVIAYRCCY